MLQWTETPPLDLNKHCCSVCYTGPVHKKEYNYIHNYIYNLFYIYNPTTTWYPSQCCDGQKPLHWAWTSTAALSATLVLSRTGIITFKSTIMITITITFNTGQALLGAQVNARCTTDREAPIGWLLLPCLLHWFCEKQWVYLHLQLQ